jgi:hypothetical protein
MDKNKEAGEKLVHNRESLDTALFTIQEVVDNRLDRLHPARFLPGAMCSASKLWLEARSVLGRRAIHLRHGHLRSGNVRDREGVGGHSQSSLPQPVNQELPGQEQLLCRGPGQVSEAGGHPDTDYRLHAGRK